MERYRSLVLIFGNRHVSIYEKTLYFNRLKNPHVDMSSKHLRRLGMKKLIFI